MLIFNCVIFYTLNMYDKNYIIIFHKFENQYGNVVLVALNKERSNNF